MLNALERYIPEQEFEKAMSIAAEVSKYYIDGDVEASAASAIEIYPSLRYMYENWNKYRFVLQFITDGDVVIDVPSGSGHGTSILGSTGVNVVGIDVSTEAIEYSQDMYGYANVFFENADMTLPLPVMANIITCMDGLEHVADGDALIRNFISSLKPGGILIISVPINEERLNKGDVSEFHLVEYTAQSIEALVSKYFNTVAMWGIDYAGSVSDISNAFNGVIAVCEGAIT